MFGSFSWGPSRSPIFRFATKNVNAVLKNAFEGEFKWLKSCFHGYNPILGINKLDGETFYHLRWLPPWIFKMAGLHVLWLCLRLKHKSSIIIGTIWQVLHFSCIEFLHCWFVHSLREGDRSIYVQVIDESCDYIFTGNQLHSSRWPLVHVKEVVELEWKHPHIHS